MSAFLLAWCSRLFAFGIYYLVGHWSGHWALGDPSLEQNVCPSDESRPLNSREQTRGGFKPAPPAVSELPPLRGIKVALPDSKQADRFSEARPSEPSSVGPTKEAAAAESAQKEADPHTESSASAARKAGPQHHRRARRRHARNKALDPAALAEDEDASASDASSQSDSSSEHSARSHSHSVSSFDSEQSEPDPDVEAEAPSDEEKGAEVGTSKDIDPEVAHSPIPAAAGMSFLVSV